MSDSKSFISKILQFPSGTPIAPEGYTVLNQIRIGQYGEYKLPIPICVKEDIDTIECVSIIIDEVAKYYGWKTSEKKGYVEKYALVTNQITDIGGYKVPTDISYSSILSQDILQIILYNIAIKYGWEPVTKSMTPIDWNDIDDE